MNEQIFNGLDFETFIKTSCKYTKNIDDSEDCTQQALLTAWDRRADIKHVGAFLKTTIHTIFVDKKRKENTHLRYVDRTSRNPQYAKSAEYLLQLAEFSEKAERVIQDLSSIQRRTLEYRLLDYSVPDIAKLMKANQGTVMSRLFYIRQKLQAELGEYADLID